MMTRQLASFVLVTFVANMGPLTTPAAAEVHITHGPVLGRLSADGIGIWARTQPAGTFAVRYGLLPERMDQITEPVPTKVEHDNTGWVHLTGLKADTKYYYELVVPGSPSSTGRGGSFQTLPNPRDYVNQGLNPVGLFNFSFEFACGNNQNPGHSIGPALPAFQTMLRKHKDEIYFAILNGDWLYERQREYKPSRWMAQVDVRTTEVPKVVRVAPTVVGVWQNYKHFFNQSENLCRWHREIPSFFMYDDHEILNDVWGAGTPGLRDRRAVFRDIGVRAWYDFLGWSNPSSFDQPIHFGRARLAADSSVLVDPEADFTRLDFQQASNLHVHWGTGSAGVNDNSLDGVGGDPNAGVYEIVKVLDKDRLQIRPKARHTGTASYSIGRRSYYRMRISNCDFFVTDTRGQRQMHDVRRPDQPGLSMLGSQQRQWLIDGMKSSDADFLFVVSSVNLMIPHVGGGAIRADNKDDAWTVFLDERERLIEFWDSLPRPVFVLTGDLHNSFVIRITDNVWEMASGPHNSNNHWASDEGNRPVNGKFKYGPREVDIRWSTHFRGDIPRQNLLHPTYCVVQVNNVYDNPRQPGEHRWIAYPRPHVIFRYYDGITGRLRYAESVSAETKE